MQPLHIPASVSCAVPVASLPHVSGTCAVDAYAARPTAAHRLASARSPQRSPIRPPQDGRTADHGHTRNARFRNAGRRHCRAPTLRRQARGCPADPSRRLRRIRGDITARCAELARKNAALELAFGRGHPDSEGKHPTNDCDDHKRPRYHDDLLSSLSSYENFRTDPGGQPASTTTAPAPRKCRSRQTLPPTPAAFRSCDPA